MFKKDNSEQPKIKETETIIGPSVKVKGNFYGDGNMVIEGVVEGKVKTKNSLHVGSKAKITASVEAKNAYISGEVLGNIKIEDYLEIADSAKITGDIEAKTLSIEKGARLNGRCSMGNAKSHEPKSND